MGHTVKMLLSLVIVLCAGCCLAADMETNHTDGGISLETMAHTNSYQETTVSEQREDMSRTWHISQGASTRVESSDSACSSSDPCASSDDVMPHIKDNDEIVVDGDVDENHVYDLCSGDVINGIYDLQKTISIIGYGAKPQITCIGNRIFSNGSNNNNLILYSTFRLNGRHDGFCHVKLKNIILLDMIMSFSNCTVEIEDVIFRHSSIVSTNPCLYINMTVSNSELYGIQDCDNDSVCSNYFENNITCFFTHLNILSSKFFQTNFIVSQPSIDTGEAQIIVEDSLFTNIPSEVQFLGGLHFTFWSNNSEISINNCTFSGLIHPTRVQSVINLYDAGIWVKATAPQSPGIPDPVNAARVSISNCTFYDNERGLTVVGTYQQLQVIGCLFEKNMAMHAGGGLLVLINPHSNRSILAVHNCIFISNMAGTYRKNYPIIEREGAFEILGKEVHLNAECCKGVVMMVGKGGAVRAQRGRVQFTDCFFVNNSAKLLGGSIMVDIDGIITINNTLFQVGQDHEHALQGDMLYSDGGAQISFVDFLIGRAMNGLSVLRHSGNHWSLNITNVWIQCPVGYNLRTTNSSAYGVHENGLKRSFLLDQLSYFCESCPRNKYSLDHGYLNYTMVFQEFAYFTLLINSSEPEAQYTGKYIHHEIECADCPYGGHCVHGITSVANFWGYIKGKSVKFQHCPKGYCCSTPNCPSINGCVEKRVGRLCGRCRPGTSEALFSPACVPNDTCGPYWLVPLGVSIGLFYTIFLLFQTDMKNLLFSNQLKFCPIRSQDKKNQRKRSLFVNGNVAAAMRLAEGSKFLGNGNDLDDKTPNGTHIEPPSTPTQENEGEFKASDSGVLIIMFYYFQDALLLNVKTVYATSESKTQILLKSILSGLFKLQLDLFELIEEVCTVPDMSAVMNVVTKAFIVPYVIIMFILTYGIYKWILCFRDQNCGMAKPISQSYPTENDNIEKKSFITRLSSGFILALLFTYQKLGTTTFILLNCVPVEGELILFIDGTISCYQYWQYAVVAYAISCVVPFFIVLMVGPSLLIKGIISLPEFFLACLCPIFFLIPWGIKHWRRRHSPLAQHTRRPLGEGTKAVMRVLQGPFRENRCGVCWAGVLIGRRLVLVLLFTFVNDSLIRLLGMLLASFCILLHHVHVQPYKDLRGNIAGTTSATALVSLASINLVRAGFEAAEYTPSGPNAFLMRVFTEIENMLLLWLPFGVMCVVTLFFLYRITQIIFSCLCKTHKKSSNRSNSLLEDLTNRNL